MNEKIKKARETFAYTKKNMYLCALFLLKEKYQTYKLINLLT